MSPRCPRCGNKVCIDVDEFGTDLFVCSTEPKCKWSSRWKPSTTIGEVMAKSEPLVVEVQLDDDVVKLLFELTNELSDVRSERDDARRDRDEWRAKAEAWSAWYSRPGGPWSLSVGGVWPSSEMTEYLDDRIRRERVEAWDEGFALGYWDGYNTGCPPGTEIEEHHGRTEAQSTWAQQNNPYRDDEGGE